MLFTSESVTEGHPDKLADQISDGILDAILAKDPHARVGCETALSGGLVVVLGEISTKCYVEIPEVVKNVIEDVGYCDPAMGIDFKSCAVLTSISKQSPDIAQGVNNASDDQNEMGAGDQGMMFGYAIKESPELLPLSISYAHKLARRLAKVRKEGIIPYLWPDGKTQATIQYDDSGKPVSIETLVISAQHHPKVTQAEIKDDVIRHVVTPVISPEHLTPETQIHVNPTGRFVEGGPKADAGLTGRKIIIDTYGGHGSHGGGAFSGKDPSKVDRSASYMARYIAKNLVAANVCDRILVQLAYAIGRAQPVSIHVDTYGTHRVNESGILDCIRELMPLTPKGIIQHLDLLRPIYKNIAAYGHFGVDETIYRWEKTDKVEAIQAFFKLPS